MQSLGYNDVIPFLFDKLPEGKAAYNAWDMPGEPLPYIVFSLLEESFLTPIVRSGTNDEVKGRIFDCLEQLAASNDGAVIDLLAIGLFEVWAANDTLTACFSQMGPQTKALAREAVKGLKPRQLLDW